MQIIPNQLGEAFSTGLNQLAQHKLSGLTKQYEQQAERSQFAQTWEPILGKDSANFLSNLGPEERKNALLDIQNLVESFQQPEQQNGLETLSQQNQPLIQQQGQQQPGMGISQAIKQYFGQPQINQQQENPAQLQTQEQAQAPQLTPAKAKLIKRIYESPQERVARGKQEFQERQTALKETKPYVNALKDKEKASKETNLRLGRMENLIDKGNLPNAALWSSLSKLENAPYISGLTAPFAELIKGGLKWYSGNPADIEEFEKLSSEFVKNAKQYFGSRITQKEVELFMQTVPTLAQTDAGKKKLIENIRSLNELTEIEAKAARSIIRDNGGVAPIDIEQQVQDKIGKKLDKVAKKFIAR